MEEETIDQTSEVITEEPQYFLRHNEDQGTLQVAEDKETHEIVLICEMCGVQLNGVIKVDASPSFERFTK